MVSLMMTASALIELHYKVVTKRVLHVMENEIGTRKV